MTVTRRRLLRAGGLVAGVALAGCGGDDPPPGLYASRAQLVHQRGDDRLDYPGDIGVRVTLENTSSDRKSGQLVLTLKRLDRTGEEPTVVDSWTTRTVIELSRGATQSYFHVFEDVFAPGDDIDDFRASASF